MSKKHTVSDSNVSYEQRLAFIGRDFALLGPIGVFVFCAFIEYVFTDYFDPSVRPLTSVCLFLAFIPIVTRLIWRQAGRKRLAFDYVLLNIIGIIAFNVLLHFPSPYILAGAVVAVVIFFDFGLAWALASMATLYGSVIAHAILAGLPFKDLVDVIAYTIAPLFFSVTVMRLEALARQEIQTISKHSEKSTANEQRIQSLINNISDGVVAVDEHYKVIMYNAAALDVLDINLDIRGKSISKYLQPIDPENQAVTITSLLKNATTQITNRDLRINYTDGSKANIFLGIAPIYLGYGKAENNGYTIVMRDITREKSLEDERNEFISVVSHELRTPIAIAEGNISNAEFIVEKTKDVKGVQAALKESHSQVLFLASMINDLSTLSRAERGVLQVEVESINIAELAQELQSNYSKQAATKGLAFKAIVDDSVMELRSSKLYTREILQNFITNAIKYTAEGGVTLHISTDTKGLKFAVTDTGIGISKGDQEKVFDKFFRSEDYRTRQASGTGLGLYVTMKLTRLIHAEIELTSELDKGSTFTIHIPNLA